MSGSTSNTYKSYEQFKARVFPELIEEEKRQAGACGSKQLGTSLANGSMDELLRRRRRVGAQQGAAGDV